MHEDSYHDDLTLTTMLNHHLRDVPGDTSTVSVEVEDGVAYLDGVVNNSELRNRVEKAALEVEGVRNVINSLVIEHVITLSNFGYVPIHPSLDKDSQKIT